TRFSRDWSSDVCSSDLFTCVSPASRYCPFRSAFICYSSSIEPLPRSAATVWRLFRSFSLHMLLLEFGSSVPAYSCLCPLSQSPRPEERRVGKECSSRGL